MFDETFHLIVTLAGCEFSGWWFLPGEGEFLFSATLHLSVSAIGFASDFFVMR
jgi:hypothetical protein